MTNQAADAERRGFSWKHGISWALYDWGNSAFATVVMAVFFPLFLGRYWIGEGSETNSTFVLGVANSVGSLIIVLLAPVLGSIADRGSSRKRYLMVFAFFGALMTGLLFMVQSGQWMAAVLLYAGGLIGFSGSNIFYDSLLVGISRRDKRDFLSSLGFSLGYLGGGLLFLFVTLMVQKPETFGFADGTAAIRMSFLLVALWWGVFTLPVLLFVPEAKSETPSEPLFQSIKGGIRQVGRTFREIRQLKNVFLFLLAYWLYIDGVDTIVRMAVDFGQQINLPDEALVRAILLTQFVAFPATLIYGKAGERFGAKKGIFFGIGVYALLTIFALFMKTAAHFYTLAVVVGLVQGGVQALSRSFFSKIIPQEKSAEFFGFYNMLGKFAAIIGPLMVGVVSSLTGNPRMAIASILILFIGGAYFLLKVKDEEISNSQGS